MSGYLTVANEAIAIARSEPAYTAAVLRLYMDADLRNWGPFDCADIWMMRTFELTKREARDLLRRLVQAGCLVVEFEGDNNTPRSVRILRPENASKRLDRGANRVRNRAVDREKDEPKPIVEDSGPRVEPRRGPRVELREDTSSTSTSTSTPVDTSHPADAGAPHWPPVSSRKKPSGTYHLAIQVWDAEHLSAFGVSYPWVFHGRDADGARIKSWLSTARVTIADPTPGLERLRRSFRAYFDAVQSGDAWPRGDPASTRHYTRDIAKWLQVDPDNPIRVPEKESFASKEMRRLWQQADEEERALAIQEDHPESDSSPPGLRVLQRAP